jgi:hypothetical protein
MLHDTLTSVQFPFAARRIEPVRQFADLMLHKVVLNWKSIIYRWMCPELLDSENTSWQRDGGSSAK